MLYTKYQGSRPYARAVCLHQNLSQSNVEPGQNKHIHAASLPEFLTRSLHLLSMLGVRGDKLTWQPECQ